MTKKEIEIARRTASYAVINVGIKVLKMLNEIERKYHIPREQILKIAEKYFPAKEDN